MTVFTDNPAGRLHALVTGFKRNASQHQAYVAWAATLGMQGDLSRLLDALSMVLELPSEVEAEIDRVDPDEFDRDSVMRWHGTISPVFSNMLFSGEQSSQVANKISDAAMGSLESCSFVLHRHRRQQVLSEGDIDRIRSLVADLTAAIEDDLEAEYELRTFLLRHAKAMARALDHYQIVGTLELEDALDQAVGAVQRRGGEFESKGYTRREAWKRFAALAAGVLVVLQVPQTALELPGEIRDAIEGPPGPDDEKVVIHETIIVAPEQARPEPAAPEHDKATSADAHKTAATSHS